MERTKEQKLAFIQVNHFLMTIDEMATELNTRDSTVSRFCNQLGVVAITEKEREIEKAAAERKKRKKVVDDPLTPEDEIVLLNAAAFIYKGVSPALKKKLQEKYTEPFKK